jgi:hypothetical protein
MKTLEAEEAASHLHRYFCDFGAPRYVQTDWGTQYLNATLTGMVTTYGFKHIVTTPDSSEENGIVERCNKEILKHIRAICQDQGIASKWSTAIDIVKRIRTTTEHESTGHSPAELTYGPAANVDRFCIEHPVEIDSELTGLNWLKVHAETQRKAIEITQAKLKSALDEKQRNARQPVVFEDESYVIVEYPSTQIPTGAPVKIRTHKKGPMKVLGHENGMYRVRDLFNHTESDVHISRLTKFLHDKNRVDPESVAFRDHDVWKVEKVVEFQNRGPKKNWRAMVRYEGLGPEEDSWIEWKEGRKMQMHDYLREHNKSNLIPVQFISNCDR